MTYGATLTYIDSLFRQQVPAFASVATYPSTTVSNFWNIASNYLSTNNYGFLVDDARQYALNLMTAHLLQLNNMIASGQIPQVLTGATVDKVTVSLEPPPQKTAFQYWLSTTPYGMQLRALLMSSGAGGFYVPGSMGRNGFTW